MKKHTLVQLATHILALFIGLGIGYGMWNTSSEVKPISATNEAPPKALKVSSSPADNIEPTAQAAVLDSTQETTTTAVEEKKEEQRNDQVVEKLPTKATGATMGDGHRLDRIKMGISDNKISTILSAVSENMEAKNLAYISSLMQDCSGIFHQLKDSLQSRLPALAQNGGGYQYPAPTEARSSRQIADWYYKKNNLLIVEDAVAARNSIRPGSVMFYGKSGKKFSNINIDMLTDRNNNYTSNGAIMHIAVVTAVTTDADGNVVDYTIMHGRNKKYPASRSGSKEVQSRNTPNLPPFGNWSQQLVAIANIATPSS